MDKEKSRQGSLLLQMGGGSPKSVCTEQRTLPYLSLIQVLYLSPFHRSGQGAHSSQLANLKQIVTGRRGKEGSHRKGKLEQNGVTKISFNRKDIVTFHNSPFHFLSNNLFFKLFEHGLALMFYCVHQEHIGLLGRGSQLL